MMLQFFAVMEAIPFHLKPLCIALEDIDLKDIVLKLFGILKGTPKHY